MEGKQAKKKKLPQSPFPHWLAFILSNPLRKLLLKPQKVIAAAGIKEGQVVLEVGCGPGFFTEYIAKKVGAKGKVIAQDVQVQMLNKLKRRLRRFPVKDNIQLLLASSSATGLPEASVDFIFAANVFEEIAKEGELEATVRELYRLLKADGVLFFGEHRIPQTLLNNILNELEKAGFKLKQKLDNLFFAAALYQK